MKIINVILIVLITLGSSSCKKADLTGIDELIGRYQCQGFMPNQNQPFPYPYECNWSLEIEKNGRVNFVTPGTPNGTKSRIRSIVKQSFTSKKVDVSLELSNGKELQFGLYGDTISEPFWGTSKTFTQSSFYITFGVKMD